MLEQKRSRLGMSLVISSLLVVFEAIRVNETTQGEKRMTQDFEPRGTLPF